MFLFYMLILLGTEGAVQYQFNMYDTGLDQDGYCLLYYVNDDNLRLSLPKRAHQIIPYCLRSLDESISIESFNSSSIIDSTITFAELEEQNISSELLISWSATIDQAESYQIFLNHSLNSSSEAKTLFYNCTFPWFGPLCRFAFEIRDNVPLNWIVYSTFGAKGTMPNDVKVTCYKHLQCDTSLICLDWREICDGKSDCLDGSDEFGCWQLEMNECNKNEYRCYNGQCIPDRFFHEFDIDPDCLDRTDEFETDDYPKICWQDPAFRCEEHKCHPGTQEFSCGDGYCREEPSICSNLRNTILNMDSCSYAMACEMRDRDLMNSTWCEEHCPKFRCVLNHCPPYYEFPPRPILFEHVRLIFSRKEVDSRTGFHVPKYVCYNEKLCVDFLPATVYWNDSTCRYIHELGLKRSPSDLLFSGLVKDIKKRFRRCLMASDEIHYLNQPMMYRCHNSSKYISKYHLLDMAVDCPFGDDELFNNESCSLNDAPYRYHCAIDDRRLCFAPFIPDLELYRRQGPDHNCRWLDLEYSNTETRNDEISFQTICDGYQDLLPISIDEQNQTDETGCEHWLCNNTYTRCDGFWSCDDGADEANCPPSTCPEFYHNCIFPNDTLHMSCLPMDRAGNGIVDCLGATDERKQCQYIDSKVFQYQFSCWNDTKCLTNAMFCNGKAECQFGDDELYCDDTKEFLPLLCYKSEPLTEVENFVCNLTIPIHRIESNRYFKLSNILTYPPQINSSVDLLSGSTENRKLTSEKNLIPNMRDVDGWRCNRGLAIYIRTSIDTHNLSCLCPPSYYGNECQYQNQRVSLTVQIRATSDWSSVFTFLIFLIDDEGNIESHDYIEYLSSRDCNIKFNVYLLYSTRPKNLSKNYSIRIDAFNRMKMRYRASWVFPLQFPFLPVHRLPVRLIIPTFDVQPLLQCSFSCIHGKCFKFVNDQNTSFCQCFSGWSGLKCNKKYLCNCEVSSKCIDDSICLCPMGRFGPRCYLSQSSCHSKSCLNDGKCIEDDERYTDFHKTKSICICPPGYIGVRCEYKQNRQTQIDISFDNSLIIPPLLSVHLIQGQYNNQPNETSIMQKIRFDQSSLTFYTSTIFNLAFGQMFKDYYLIILREENITFSHISIKIMPSHRCASIDELFNATILEQELLQRIKLYHIPCNKQHELVCFFDSVHFCLCDRNRRANCFRFNRNVTYDCEGYNLCENNGQCLLNDRICPTATICVCSQCSFGSRCQFSTEGSTLLLDIILGYRIISNIKITEQPIIVKVAVALTIIIFVLGLISNVCTVLTFQMKNTRSVGCGIYLLTSAINNLIIICILTIKFWLLLMSQIGSIKARSFVQMQCISTDYLLRVLLISGDWLYACVSVERAMTISHGVHFDTFKSTQIAKRILLFVFVFVSCTHIHDPIHRRLVSDDEEQRTWCITKYSLILKIWDWIVNIIHFSIPFVINFISGLFIIITAARTRSNVQTKLSYRHLLREQFRHHKHLLISSLVLVLLAIPRLFISFLSGCMKSTRDSWLYLIGYYISFIPSMISFIIFVVPSKMYIREFKKSIKRFL